MIRDLRYAIRTLLKAPSFTLVAILTLALGIAANTTIFSAVDAVLLHPLSFPHPEQLVSVTKTMPAFDLFQSVSSALDFLDYRSQSKSFSEMAALERGQFNLTGNQQPERLPGMRVSPNLFSLLGVTPILGRSFSPGEDQIGRDQVVIVSEPLWKTHFGSNRDILGQQIELDGRSFTVVGVARPMLTFLSNADLFMPLSFTPDRLEPNQRGHQNLDVVARIKPGLGLAQVNADLRQVAAVGTIQHPDWYPKGWTIDAAPLESKVSGPVRTPLLVLVGAVALVLLIACANVANLLLVRASARHKEISIRTALGAGRFAIVRQLMAECGIIAATAGAIGLTASIWVLDLFERFGPRGLLSGQHLTTNLYIAGFTLAVSVLATLLFGLAPAIAASHADLNDALKETSRGSSGGAARRRLRSVLMASEVALSLTLLISAGLLIRSFVRLQQSNPGFDPAHVAIFQVSLPAVSYKDLPSIAAFHDQLLTRLRALPGVTEVGAVDPMPFSGSNTGGSFNIIGRKWDKGTPDVAYRRANAGFFAAMRIPVLKGRGFTAQDGANAPQVVVVDEPFVKRFFANEDPIGKQLSGPNKGGYTIVGVVAGIKNNSLANPPEATIYYSGLQVPTRAISVAMRTAGDNPLNVLSGARQVVESLDHNLPVYRPTTMEERLSISLARTRFSTTLLLVFASLALVLAAIGIYGVISYLVSQRAREIGIRMALGARPSDAVGMILRQGSMPVVAGIVAGFLGSLAATRVLSGLLYDVSATDPLVFAGVSIILAAVALVASYLPARKATRVDPMIALRYE